jgi:hypothetical protein
MNTILPTIIFCLCALFAFGQEANRQADKDAIKEMCGCYSIIFKYAETFRSDTSYDFHDNYATGAPAEWVFVDEETEDKLVLQHILVVRDTIVIKHWRQDWTYENTDLYAYDKNHIWNYENLDSKDVGGQWTQKVYQVDDGPRYEGSASWIHEDGKHYWESNSDSPLPRREYTKRDDYNVMNRLNRHEITDYGWVHEQDNKKIIRKNGQDSVLVMEKGYNIYKKIDESKCQAAKDYWEEHKDYWRLVREVWSEVFDEKETLNFQIKVDDKKRYERLFKLENDYTGENKEDIKKEIRRIIDLYRLNTFEKPKQNEDQKEAY